MYHREYESNKMEASSSVLDSVLLGQSGIIRPFQFGNEGLVCVASRTYADHISLIMILGSVV